MNRLEAGEVHREELLALLRKHQAKKHYLPSVATMAREMGMGRTAIVWHLEKLREAKDIDFEDGNMARSLRLT